MTMRLSEIADALDSAERQGKIPDNPEGSGYIMISDTLAKQIANNLREIDKLFQTESENAHRNIGRLS